MPGSRLVKAFLVFCILSTPAVASAQSALAGLVTDTSGGVLPGVTVEAASPVLIEKVRAAVTDGSGRYDIINLRPGTYSITFSLAGFSTVRREGVVVGTDVTVTINAPLSVGSLEETITVSGATPLVDVRQATQTQNLGRELVDNLPSQRTLFGSSGTIPGIKMATPDVGGQRMMQHSAAAVQVHGLSGGENIVQIDGMNVNTQQSDGSVQMYFNDSMTEEISYQTSALTAEVSHGGLRQNMIPRQGGNTFSGVGYFSFTPEAWINRTVPPELARRNLSSTSSIERLYDYNVGLGGPVVRDKIWFYSSYQERSVNDIVAGLFDKEGNRAVLEQWIRNPSVRLTYQMSGKNKLTAYYDRALKEKTQDAGFGTEFPTASQRRPWQNGLYYVGQLKFTSTITSRILLEVGHSQVFEDHTITCQPGINKARGTPEWFAGASRVDLDLGTRKTACSGGHHPEYPRRYVDSATLSYASGSHSIKAGFQWSQGDERQGRDENADLAQNYRSGRPDSVDIAMSPVTDNVIVKADRGIFVQDAWTIKQLTVNYGIRFEHFNSMLPAYFKEAGRFAPARQFPEVPNLPNWNDVTPRLGVVYDLRGDGKTALKFGANKYMRQWASGFARRYSPILYTLNDRRTWSDLNNDDIAQDNEIGPSNNNNFGIALTRRPDRDIQREYTVEYMGSVQHELLPNVSVSAGYYRRLWYNLEKQDNLLVDPDRDYTAIPVANPLNNGENFTVFNLNRNRQGQIDVLDSTTANDGRTYDGIELNANARFGNGGTIFGGWSTERTVTTLCERDNPNERRFCDQSGKLYQELGKNAAMPFRWDAKVSATHPLPLQFRASVSIQSIAGGEMQTTWGVPTSVFSAPNSAGPGATGRTVVVTVPLTSPGTEYLDRRSLVDIGIRRPFKAGRVTMVGGLDIFNTLNALTVLSQNNAFGAALGNPQTTLVGRMFRLSLNTKW